jgi:hypothetical protein
MNCRTLLKFAVAGITLIATNGVVFAAGAVNYKDGIVKKALADGKPFSSIMRPIGAQLAQRKSAPSMHYAKPTQLMIKYSLSALIGMFIQMCLFQKNIKFHAVQL